MQLQVAFDRLPLERAVTLTEQLRQHADWLEVGTSLIKRYGLWAVERIVTAAGTMPVLADTKTADDAASELSMFYDAGARSATVLGAVELVTVEKAIGVAAERGAEIVIDLLGVDESRRRALVKIAASASNVLLAVHVGRDARAGRRPADALGAWAVGTRLAIAGGLTAADVSAFHREWPDIRVIAGSAVTRDSDPVAAASAIRVAMGGNAAADTP